jgi:hypothetical protein
MKLCRVTKNAFDPSFVSLSFQSDDFRFATFHVDVPPETTEAVAIRFPRFGDGAKRQSDFEVHVEWKDVERMIHIFCNSGQPEAIAIRHAIKLAAAVQKAGWQPTASPQSN